MRFQPKSNQLYNAIEEAVNLAQHNQLVVGFTFNEWYIEVFKDDTFEEARTRISQELGFEILSPEEMAEKFKKQYDDMVAKAAQDIADAGVMTEAQMRDAVVPTAISLASLDLYIDSLVKRPHDYGTTVYAMSMAATAAFNYVASKLGVTGFQAFCADMDILRRTRGYEHGFRIVHYGDLMWPQCWDKETAGIFMAVLRDPENRKKFAELARKNLAEPHGTAKVRAHWTRLAALPTLPNAMDIVEKASALVEYDPAVLLPTLMEGETY